MTERVSGQVLRYAAVIGIVSIATFAAGYTLALKGFEVRTIVNALIVPAGIVRFFLYKYWVFKNTSPRWFKQPALFVTIASAGYLLFLAVQYVSIHFFDVPEWPAFAMAGWTVVYIRFLLLRKVFENKPPTTC